MIFILLRRDFAALLNTNGKRKSRMVLIKDWLDKIFSHVFSEDDEQNGGPVNGVRRNLQTTEDSDPSSVFDSVFISMSDTLNSINTLESYDPTPEDKPLNTSTNRTPLSPHDILTRYDLTVPSNK